MIYTPWNYHGYVENNPLEDHEIHYKQVVFLVTMLVTQGESPVRPNHHRNHRKTNHPSYGGVWDPEIPMVLRDQGL